MKYPKEIFTYGSELELADVDTRIKLPEGSIWDYKDGSIANSNGLANDPKKEFNIFGGEINVKPTCSIEEQVEEIMKVYSVFNNKYSINYSCNLHIHVGVPGLSEDLESLKKLQEYIRKYDKLIFNFVDPIPNEKESLYKTKEDYKGAKKRQNRRKGSHHRRLSNNAYERMMNASTIKEFYEAHAPLDKNGKLCWGVAPRAGINLQQLFNETNTVEFRHFPGTDNPEELYSCLLWCREFMDSALNTNKGYLKLKNLYNYKFPKFKPYNAEIDKIFVKTAVTMNKRKEVLENIKFFKKMGII